MIEFNYTVKDEIGLHARPAGLLVKEAKKFNSDITVITSCGKSADAKKLFALMSLAITKGDTVTVKIDGSDESEAKTAIYEFMLVNL